MRQGGVGILDILGMGGKYGKGLYVFVTKRGRQSFNIITAVSAVIFGLMLWIALEILSPEKKITKGPLDMAPPSAQETNRMDTGKLTIKDIAPQ